MPLPCPGPAQISLVDIQNEFGGSNPIGLNEYYRNGGLVPSNNTSVPTSGAISLGDFFCANLPPIGAPFQGGFFAGVISHTANSVATHALIVAPRSSGETSEEIQWKTSATFTAGTTSPFDGALNSSNMNDASHPAAQYCKSLTIGGYSDWYLPARYELDIAYQNLRPLAGEGYSYINPYSVPQRTANGTVAQTSVAAFQRVGSVSGPEAFDTKLNSDDDTPYYWSSTESNTVGSYADRVEIIFAWLLNFGGGDQYEGYKDEYSDFVARAFRRVAL